MELTESAPAQTAKEEEIPLEELVKEFKKIGRGAFQKKYTYPFLVSVAESAKDADLFVQRTMIADRIEGITTLEGPPNRTGQFEKETCLRVSKSDRNGYVSKITVGRARNNDIVLRMQMISKLHAAFIVGANESIWEIMDMGSTNGTRLNEVRLKKNEPNALKSGDIVAFGGFSFRFLVPVDLCKLLSVR